MEYLWAILLIGFNTLCLLSTLLLMPGNWLMLMAAGALTWWRPGTFGYATLAAAVVLAILGEVVEALASMAGVKKAGGSRLAGWASVLGAFLGALVGTVALPIPVIGTLVGLCVGAAAGAIAVEFSSGRTHRESMRSGLAAGAGQLAGTVGKFMIGILIWLILAVAVFWP
jgi:hypothetical protein